MHQVDGVLADVALLFERRHDVDRRVRDDQRLGIRRHVEHVDVADAPLGAQARLRRDDGAEQFVGVKAAFHQRTNGAGRCKLDRFGGSCVAVLGRLDAQAFDRNAGFLGSGGDLVRRTDEHRFDEAFEFGFDRGGDCFRTARMHDRGRQRGQRFRLLEELIEAAVTTERDFRYRNARQAQFFGWCDDRRLARQHFLAVLVDARGIENDALVRPLLTHGDGCRDGIARRDRTTEAQVLAEVDRSRSR